MFPGHENPEISSSRRRKREEGVAKFTHRRKVPLSGVGNRRNKPGSFGLRAPQVGKKEVVFGRGRDLNREGTPTQTKPPTPTTQQEGIFYKRRPEMNSRMQNLNCFDHIRGRGGKLTTRPLFHSLTRGFG